MTMRKMLAILATLAILCAVLPLGSIFSAVADGAVIENSTFDEGTQGWSSSSQISVEDGVLKFECTQDWANVYKYANGMQPNTDYVYTFKAKANMDTTMNIKINDNWAKDSAHVKFDVTTEWQEFTVNVNSGDYSSAPILMFSANVPASTGLVFYLDYVTITEGSADEPEQPEEPADGNLIVNGDFETGDASGWETWQSTSISADAAKDGAYGAHLVGNGSWGGMLNQTVAVEAGKQYKLSFWINVNAMGVNLQVKDGAGNAIEGAGGWFDSNKKDTLVEWTFTATDGSVFINFCGSGSAPEDVYVDNFSLVCISTGDEPVDDGLVKNGGFETGDLTNWTNLWNSCAVSFVDGYESSYAINIVAGGWSQVRQDMIPVDANSTYKLSAMVKDATNFGLIVKKGDDSGDVANVLVESATDWTEASFEFETGDLTAICVLLIGWDGGGSATIDNVVLEKIGGSEPDQPDQPDEPDEPVTPPSGDVLNATFDGGETDGISSSSDISVADGVLQFNVTKDWGNVYVEGVAAEKNTDYEITLRAKSKLGKKFWVKFNDSWGSDIASADLATSTSWKDYTFTLNSGSFGTLVFLIQYAGYAAEGETVWFDYITIKKAGGSEPDVPADGLLSEDFEDALSDAWKLDTKGTSGIVDGAMKLEGNAYEEILTSPVIALKKGVTYTISFDIKLINKGEINFQIKNCYEDDASKGGNILIEYIRDAKTDAWTTYTYSFKNEDLARDFASLLFVNNANTDFYLDNVVVTSDEEPEEPDVPTDSALVNGGFENGSEGWELNSSASVTDEDAHTGNYSLKLENPGMWAAAAVQNVAVKPNTEYVIEMWVNRIENKGALNLFLMDAADNRNLDVVEGQIWFNTNTNGWEKKTIVINTGAASEIVLKWSSETNNAGIMLIDDMSVSEKNAPQPSAGLVVNGDFETGDNTGWEKWQSTVISEDAAKNGKYGANLLGNGSWGGMLNQTFDVEEGETYIITLWVCVNGAGGVNLQIKDAEKVEGECDNTYLDPKELNAGWVERKFTVVATGNTMTLNFCGGGTEKPEDVYIDDVVVTKKGEAPAVEETYPIKNAGFETNELHSNITPGGVTGAWYNVWGSCVVGFDSPGHDKSNYALNFQGPGAWQQVRQDGIPVEPNTDYTLIAYLKNPLNINLVVKTADDVTNIADYGVENDMSNTWVRQEVSFNSGDQTAVCVLIISNADGNGSAIVDNVQIYKKGEEPAEPEPDAPATEGPIVLDSFSASVNRPVTPDANLILNGSFEDAEGGQWQDVLGDVLYVVDDETAPSGNKSLYFNTSGVEENNMIIFYVDVQPNTDYVFSAWVKGAFISDDNRYNATIGVTDWKDKFVVYYPPEEKTNDTYGQFSNKDRQIVPPCWDNEWHLRAVQFNSGVNTKIGIGFSGSASQLWIDDIALFTVDNGIKYADGKQNSYIAGTPSYDKNEAGCADDKNLIPNGDMNGAEEFWSDAMGYGNGFVTFVDGEYEYGASMKYTQSYNPCGTHMIKWIDVEPNTEYTFSVNIRIVESGNGSLTLIDSKARNKESFAEIEFDQYYEGNEWFTKIIHFNSGNFDRIGICVVDGGGVALIDNMRLFKRSDVKTGVEDSYKKPPYAFGSANDPHYVGIGGGTVNPDNPDSPVTGVSVLGAVVAIALVPSAAAVAFKLRRKKEDEE